MKDMEPGRKIRYTRKVLADSLVELMRDKPFTKITVKELCEKADINRATFYSHYRSQHDLLRQIEDETISYFEDMLKKNENRRSKREVQEMLEEMFNFIAGNSDSFKILLSENGDTNFQQKVLRRFMRQGQVMKYFSEMSVSPETQAYWYAYVVNGAIGLIQHWLKNNMAIPVSELAKIVLAARSPRV
jgi:AcrR family transcriptional regulator